MNKRIGQFIRELREQNQISQAQIAEELGVSRPTYIAVEMGEREISLKEAEKLASILGTDIESLSNPPKESNFGLKKSSKLDISKFKSILLYMLLVVGAKPNIGLTAIYKLLYFIEFDYYEKYKTKLTNATFIKNYFGPTPTEFAYVLKDMIAKHEIMEVSSKYFKKEQKKFLPLIGMHKVDLSKKEINHIDGILNALSDMNASELSEYSHKDAPWELSKQGEILDYDLVFKRAGKHRAVKRNL